MPRSNHRNAGLREGSNISTNLEHEWRIVDLAKSRWVLRIVERYEMHACCRSFSQPHRAAIPPSARCRATARIAPAIRRASSWVSEALKTDSTLPKKSTTLLARVGPSPGVRVRASQEIWLELALKLNRFESQTPALGKTASPGGQCRL